MREHTLAPCDLPKSHACPNCRCMQPLLLSPLCSGLLTGHVFKATGIVSDNDLVQRLMGPLAGRRCREWCIHGCVTTWHAWRCTLLWVPCGSTTSTGALAMSFSGRAKCREPQTSLSRSGCAAISFFLAVPALSHAPGCHRSLPSS